MGAIFGIIGVGQSVSAELLGKMHVALCSRGSELATRTTEQFAMGVAYHSHEYGPFLVSNEPGTVLAVCEGELYNVADLRRMYHLLSPSHGFAIIPELFESRGKDFVRELNGVFSIALFDVGTRTLYLARDHAGSHSVFYSATNAAFVFATTIPALFASGFPDRSLSSGALDGYLACLAVSSPETMFERVASVRPGHLVEVSGGVPREYCYWPLHEVTENRRCSEANLAEEVRHLFFDAVKIRAACPPTHAVLVSGGVDTTAIAAVLSHERSPRALHGFSILFEEQEYSDAALQELVYQKYALNRHQLVLSSREFCDGLIDGARYLDSPVNDVAYVGMYKVMELAKRAGVHAVFEGEGSDEIFCTGHSHGERSIQPLLMIPEAVRRATFGLLFRHMPTGGSLAHKVRRFGCRLGMPEHERLSTWIPAIHDLLRCRLHPDTEFPRYPYPQTRYYLSAASVADPLNRYNYLLSRLFLADDLLFKNERMSAAHGVVNRTPFIDHRLMEKAFTVPARFKLRKPTATDDMTKLVFKKAMEGIVPEAILHRKKTRGFSHPTSVWYRGELKPFVTDVLLGPSVRIAGLLDKRTIREICDMHTSGAADLNYSLNALVVLELWMRAHL